MNTRWLISGAGGLVLTMGAVVILLFISMFLPSYLPQPLQESLSYIIFFLSLLVLMPLFSRRLHRLDSIDNIIGWTFIGLGAEFIIFPVPLLLLVLMFPSMGGLVFGGLLLTVSIVFGIPAGLTSIVIGGFILKRRKLLRA